MLLIINNIVFNWCLADPQPGEHLESLDCWGHLSFLDTTIPAPPRLCCSVSDEYFLQAAKTVQVRTFAQKCDLRVQILFLNSHSGGWSPNWVHSVRRPLNGLLYPPRVIMVMENLVEWRLAGEAEVLGENLPQRHFVHHTSTWPDPGSNPGRRGGKPATNCLSYGAALPSLLVFLYVKVV
jgi:hypothetical protein